MKNLDFGGQISPTDRSFFSLNSPNLWPEKGGLRARNPECFPSILSCAPREPRESDVNGIRSEPGNTRLSKDDGSIHKANSLK